MPRAAFADEAQARRRQKVGVSSTWSSVRMVMAVSPADHAGPAGSHGERRRGVSVGLRERTVDHRHAHRSDRRPPGVRVDHVWPRARRRPRWPRRRCRARPPPRAARAGADGGCRRARARRPPAHRRPPRCTAARAPARRSPAKATSTAHPLTRPDGSTPPGRGACASKYPSVPALRASHRASTLRTRGCASARPRSPALSRLISLSAS